MYYNEVLFVYFKIAYLAHGSYLTRCLDKHSVNNGGVGEYLAFPLLFHMDKQVDIENLSD